MKQRRKYHFTLAELLVSMAVFSLLLVLMMQFFSGARQLMTANDKRTALYSDARMAMDLMQLLLQSSFYNTTDGMPFVIKGAPVNSNHNDTTMVWNSSIYFPSDSDMDLSKGSSVRFLGLKRGGGANDNILQLRIFSDQDTAQNFALCFPPFGIGDCSAAAASTHVADTLAGFSDTDTDHTKVILRNVTGFKITPLNPDMTRKYTATADYNAIFPAGVELELSLMQNEEAVQRWKNIADTDAKAEFRAENEYTFRRTVMFGERNYKYTP